MKAIKWLGIGALVITTTLFWASAQTKQVVEDTKDLMEVELPLLPGAENLQPLDLPVMKAESVPDTGTFWSAQRFESEPPMPFARFPDLPVYSLGNGQMLVDDRAVDIDLYFQQLDAQRLLARAARGESLEEAGGGEVLAMRLVQNYNGVDLLLDLEDITNGVAAFSIYCPSNDVGYDLFGTTNLSLATEAGALNATNWVWLYRASGGETNFTVPMTWEAEAYFRLAGTNDTDGDSLSDAFEALTSHSSANTNDSDGDSLLDAWEWTHFASFEPTDTGDYDGDGYDNAYEQAATSDPNTLTFTAHIGYGQTASLNPSATLTLLGGVPADYAVMVDSTNFASPNWQAFTTSPAIPLPDAEGEHLVWVALRGRVNATAWQGFGVTLDRVAPVLVITSPTNSTTSKPIIQVTGYTTDAVGAVSCTLSNATGLQTNLSALATETDFGPVTTNHFQVFDVELTNGVNAMTVQVSDLAGNVSTTNLSITFDTTGDSNAPALAVLWPQNGAKLGADLFTLRARVDDETASVQASVVSPSGATNEYTATVERNGAVWVEDIALEAGTNLVALTATDAATNSYVTNLTLIRSSVNVTIAEPGNLNDAFVTVSGTVSDGSYSVWVNGVMAAVSGNAWSAASVPLAAGGSAVVAVTVIPPGGNGEGGSGGSGGGDPSENNPSDPDGVEFSLQPEKPAEVKLVHGEWERHDYFYDDFDLNGYDGIYNWDYLWRWDEKSGGYAERTERCEFLTGVALSGVRYWIDVHGMERFERWEDEPGNITGTNAFEISAETWPGFGGSGPWAQGRWATSASYDGNTSSSEMNALANVVLRTGGRSESTTKNLFIASASAVEKTATGESSLPAPTQTIASFGTQGADAMVPATHPDNAKLSVNVQAPAAYYTFNVGAPKHKILMKANNVILDSDKIVEGASFCVGQKIIFQPAFFPALPTGIGLKMNYFWVLPPKFVNAKEEWWSYGNIFEQVTCHPVTRSFSRNKGYFEDVNPACTRYLVTDGPLTQPETGAWWVSSGKKLVSCYNDVIFNNGHKVSLVVRGQFNMLKPEITSVEPPSPIAPGGSIEELGGPLGPMWLMLANGTMNFVVHVSQNCPGKFGVTQLVKYEIGTGLPIPPFQWWQSSGGEYYLDGSLEFYALERDVALPWRLDDSPACELIYSWGSYDGHWKSYVRFTPDGNDNIPITLGRIDWSWSSWAEQSAPYLDQDWTVDPELDSVSGPTLHADDVFPEWTRVKSGQ